MHIYATHTASVHTFLRILQSRVHLPQTSSHPHTRHLSIIYYPSEELEELDLDEIAKDGHMVLLPQGGLQ
jgi:hypothetical protein